MKRKMLLFTLAIPAILSQDLQAQNASRLTAESHWVNNGVIFTPEDSSGFNYSGGRGGDLTHTLKYDNATTWNFVDTSTGYENFTNYIQTFDANNNITSITYQYWSGTEWVLSTKTLYTYNANNQPLTMTLQNWGGSAFIPVSQDVYSYNAANKLYIDQFQNWDALTSAFDNVSQKTYIYDGSDNLVNETDVTYVSGSPVYTNKFDYTYTPGTAQLLNTIASTWNGTAWVGVSQATNSYDGSGDLTNKLYSLWDIPSGSYINDSLQIYSYTTPGSMMPQSDIVQLWNNTGSGNWNNLTQYTYTYNSYNQLTSATGTSWNVVGVFEFANGDPMANYYYSTFDSTAAAAVKNVVTNGGDVNIYPVPARNMLHIDLNWNTAQAATIAIFDMEGSVVRQWDAPSATQYNSAIPVNNLAAGTYIVRINGAAQGQIIKQIVVAH